MLKILHIYKNYYPENIGGVAKCIDSLAQEIQKQGYTSSIVTTTVKKQSYVGEVNGNQVYYFPATLDIASSPFSLAMLKNLKTIAADYDILNYHFPWPYADFMQLVLNIKKPFVITYHSDILKQKFLKLAYLPLLHRHFKRAAAVAATSENYLNSSPILNRYRAKTTVIPIGVDPEAYPKVSEGELSKWRDQVGEGFFLFVGVLRYYKGLQFLLEAVKNSNLRVVIAGNGPERAKLEEMAQTLGLKNVNFVGQVSEADKVALLKLAKAVVIPSHLRTEAFCISLVEGLMYGKPLISTEIGTGTSFVNKHEFSGLVVPGADAPALREAMGLIDNNSELCQRFSRGALQHYQQNFTIQRMADRYINLYERVKRENEQKAT